MGTDVLEKYCEGLASLTAEEERDLLRTFDRIRSGRAGCTVSLLNYYKGIPVSYDVEIIDVAPGSIEIKVHRNQVVILNSERRTFVKCGMVDKGIAADVIALDGERYIVSLGNFRYAQSIPAERRECVRVMPDNNSMVKALAKGRPSFGRLLDISLRSLSALMPKEVPFEKGEEVSLSVKLYVAAAQSPIPLETKASLLLFREDRENPQARQYVFTMGEDAGAAAVLGDFIIRRQAQIIKEIKEMGWQA